jgi:hypothetical protein
MISPMQTKFINLFNMMKPWSMTNHQKTRIGGVHDGGYIIPKMEYNFDVCVSIGISTDVIFDRALADQNTNILMYDHTIDSLPYEHPNFHFHKLGWGPVSQNEFISLSDINKIPLVSNAKHKILKFDIEGGEFDIFKILEVEELEGFEVITFEVHWFERLVEDEFYKDALTMFQKLNKNHIPIWLHANNWGQMFLIEGVSIPQALELTFIRRDLDVFPQLSTDPIPGPYDSPNCHFRPDIVLNLF